MGHSLVAQRGVGDTLISRQKHTSCCGVSEGCCSRRIASFFEFASKKSAIASELSFCERKHFTTSIRDGKLWSGGFNVLTLSTQGSSSNSFQPAAKVTSSRRVMNLWHKLAVVNPAPVQHWHHKAHHGAQKVRLFQGRSGKKNPY